MSAAAGSAAIHGQGGGMRTSTSSQSDPTYSFNDPNLEAEERLKNIRRLEREAMELIQRLRELERQPWPNRLRHWLKKLVGIRLGLLRAHPPRPMKLPQHYCQTLPCVDGPAIAVVTPSYNQAGFLRRTLRSVLDQNYPRLEFIVQDGGSTDDSAATLRAHERWLTGWESSPDRGQAHAINLGFARTTGEIMAYLNSDDLLLPGALHYVGRFFADHPDVDVVYGHRVIIDENDWEVSRWVLPRHDDAVLTWADFVPQETLFWRRPLWDKVGGALDESFQFAMDWDLLLRFRDAGARFVRLPRFLGAFRVHAVQKTMTQLAGVGEREMARLRRRCHGRDVTPPEIRRSIRGYLLRHAIYNRLYQLGVLRY
jgi:glycosyltransferase involved in cell wall biosynthesis